MKRFITVLCAVFCCVFSLMAQEDKREVRKGNSDFKRSDYKEAELQYRRALIKDSLSVAGSYNLANTLYEQHDYQGAKNAYDGMADLVEDNENASKYYFNKGNNDLQLKDYKAAVEDFRQALLLDPGDISAKESYIYAKKMLESSRNEGQDGQNGENGENGDQNEQNDRKDQNDGKDQQNQHDQQDQQSQQQQPEDNGQQISQQQAQQILKAIQAREKETQEKVEKAKAAQAKNRQKEKNW